MVCVCLLLFYAISTAWVWLLVKALTLESEFVFHHFICCVLTVKKWEWLVRLLIMTVCMLSVVTVL